MKKLIIWGLVLSSVQFSQAQDILKAYTKSKNLQQESITPYWSKNLDKAEAYHYRPKKEHEIKYGRPILNKNFDNSKIFYDFYKEQVYAYLKNFKKFLMMDLFEEEANEGISERMINSRHRILMDLEYSIYRSQTIQIENEDLNAQQQMFLDAFSHLYNDFDKEIPKFIESYKNQNKSLVNYKRYNEISSKSLGGHIGQSSLDLLDILESSEDLLKDEIKPDLKLKYEIRELLDMVYYRNALHLIYRSAWHSSEGFIKEVNDQDIETLKNRMDDCLSITTGLMKKLKTVEKYHSDISYKNITNKYVKYVQTSGKSNFKKIISVFEKSKEITDVEIEKIQGIVSIYKEREEEYLENISTALIELKSKYMKEAKVNAKDDGFDIEKERERLSKEEQREADRARKNYWKNRNLD